MGTSSSMGAPGPRCWKECRGAGQPAAAQLERGAAPSGRMQLASACLEGYHVIGVDVIPRKLGSVPVHDIEEGLDAGAMLELCLLLQGNGVWTF